MRDSLVLLTTILLTSIAPAACSSARGMDVGADEGAVIDPDARGFKVAPDDVTYVFPYLPGSGEDLEQLLSADQIAGESALWPDDLWDPQNPSSVIFAAQHIRDLRGDSDLKVTGSDLVLHTNIDLRPGALDRHNWKVTGMRFDPCAPSTAEECAVELRLVLMPVAHDGDAAAHFIYRFEREGKADLGERDRLISELVRLAKEARRIAPESGGELGVHPALVSAERSAFSARVRAFILSHATREHLAEVAFFGEIWRSQFAGRSSDIWEFLKGRVTDGGHRFVLDPVPNVAAAAALGPQRSQMMNVRLGFFSPAAATRFDRARVAAGEVATTRDSDCVSCHNGAGAGLNVNQRMLGPFRGQLTIAPRVVAETKSVVDRVNAILERDASSHPEGRGASF